MRFKPLPEPPADRAFLAAAQRAVPLVPGSEDDCCGRLLRRLDFESRDVARTWLTFLRALGLAEEVDAGFVRTDRDPGSEAVERAFAERVFGAEEVLDALREADGPLTPDAVFERLEGIVPEWERDKRPRSWREEWEERTAWTLEWLVLFGLARATEDGYVTAEG